MKVITVNSDALRRSTSQRLIEQPLCLQMLQAFRELKWSFSYWTKQLWPAVRITYIHLKMNADWHTDFAALVTLNAIFTATDLRCTLSHFALEGRTWSVYVQQAWIQPNKTLALLYKSMCTSQFTTDGNGAALMQPRSSSFWRKRVITLRSPPPTTSLLSPPTTR